MKPHKINKTTKLEKSQVEIEAEISFDEVKKHRATALDKIQKNLNLPGFRPGHVPESVIIGKIGDLAIWEEAAEIALQSAIADILQEGQYAYIGQPQVAITKIAEGNPVEFKIRLALLPEIEISDYKKIATKINSAKEEAIEATDKDLDDAILKIRESYAQHFHTHPEGEEHKEGEEVKLPEVDKEFIKKLGDFKDIEDFKTKVREGIIQEKTHRAKEKKRLTIIEKVIADSKIDLPQILVDAELHKMEAQFADDIARFGFKVEDYLKHLGKKMEDMRKEWVTDAEKRSKLQLILNKIALTEKIEPKKEEMEDQVKKLLEQYKDIKEERVREYVWMMMTNEKVFEWLESVK
ncbi:MAG: trigger factor [Minisyncoccia bacterium]